MPLTLSGHSQPGQTKYYLSRYPQQHQPPTLCPPGFLTPPHSVPGLVELVWRTWSLSWRPPLFFSSSLHCKILLLSQRQHQMSWKLMLKTLQRYETAIAWACYLLFTCISNVWCLGLAASPRLSEFIFVFLCIMKLGDDDRCQLGLWKTMINPVFTLAAHNIIAVVKLWTILTSDARSFLCQNLGVEVWWWVLGIHLQGRGQRLVSWWTRVVGAGWFGFSKTESFLQRRRGSRFFGLKEYVQFTSFIFRTLSSKD